MPFASARSAQSSGAPLFAGVIHGVRGWNVRRGRLVAPFRDTEWKPGETVRARCDSHGRAPRRGCGCGLYALHPHSDAVRLHGHEVMGVVEAWGRVEVHADGFRAEFARPVALFLPREAEAFDRARIRELAERYGCELIRLGWAKTPAEVCASRGWGIEPRTVAELVGEVPGAERRGRWGAPLPGRPVPRWRRWAGRVVDGIVMAATWAAVGVLALLAGVFWVCMYGAMAAMGVVLVLSAFGVDVLGEGPAGQPPLERARDVEVAGAWTVDFNDEVRVHAVEVVNRGEQAAYEVRPAIAERADGRRDDIGAVNVQVPVNLAPGERGLALHAVQSDDPGASVEAGRVWAREGPANARAPARVRVWIQPTRRGCVALARITAERPLRRIHLWALTLEGGEPQRAIHDVVRDVPAGRSRRVVGRAAPCPDPIPRIRVYPAFRRGQLAPREPGRAASRLSAPSSPSAGGR